MKHSAVVPRKCRWGVAQSVMTHRRCPVVRIWASPSCSMEYIEFQKLELVIQSTRGSGGLTLFSAPGKLLAAPRRRAPPPICTFWSDNLVSHSMHMTNQTWYVTTGSGETLGRFVPPLHRKRSYGQSRMKAAVLAAKRTCRGNFPALTFFEKIALSVRCDTAAAILTGSATRQNTTAASVFPSPVARVTPGDPPALANA